MSCFPNRVLASAATFAIREEGSYGVYSASGHFSAGLRVRSESVGNERQFTDGSSFVGDGRNELAGFAGIDNPGGALEGEAVPNGAWALLLKHALHGTLSTTGGSSSYWLHTFAPSDSTFPGFSLDKRFRYRDGTERLLRYLGCRIRRFNLKIDSGALRTRAEIIASKELEVEAPLPVFQYPVDEDPFTHMNAALQIDLDGNGSLEPFGMAYDLDLTIDNNLLVGGHNVDSGRYRDILPIGVRTITGGFRCMFTPETYQLYQRFSANSRSALLVRVERGLLYWEIELPAIQLRGIPTPRVAPGPLVLDFAFRAHQHPSSSEQILAAVQNQDEDLSTLV